LKQVFVILLFALIISGCGGGSNSGNPNDPSQVSIQFSTVELVTGTGATAASGNTASVNYALWLYNPAGTDNKGAQRDAGTYTFRLGSGGVIAGFDQGVTGMRVGGKRRVYVPSNLGYGASGNTGIPPNAALVFEIELLSLTQ
jgi:FKBP-type peptidyl-prolyl cis-trans isomerase